MANKKRRLKNKQEEDFSALDEMFLTIVKRIDKVPVGEGKRTAIKWGIIASLLIAISSVLFYLNSINMLPVGTWIPAIIGAPAGVLLYMIGFGIMKRTSVGEWGVFQMREELSYKNRLKRIGIWFAGYALIFVPFGKYIPYGIGGAFLIVLVMTALATARRTSQEILWAKQGVPDPRDLEELDEKDDYTEQAELPIQESTTEADKIYYDEQRGGFGGKLK